MSYVLMKKETLGKLTGMLGAFMDDNYASGTHRLYVKVLAEVNAAPEFRGNVTTYCDVRGKPKRIELDGVTVVSHTKEVEEQRKPLHEDPQVVDRACKELLEVPELWKEDRAHAVRLVLRIASGMRGGI